MTELTCIVIAFPTTILHSGVLGFCDTRRHCSVWSRGLTIWPPYVGPFLTHSQVPIYTDLKPLVNSYIHQLVQTKWDVVVHGRDPYLVKPRLGPPKEFQHLTRAEEVVITRLRIGHTKATNFHILSRGPPTACDHCGQTLSIDHMLMSGHCH